MRVLVFGATGQVATELQLQGGDALTALGRDRADLTDPDRCAEIIRQTDAEAVINAAAYTAVDRAEQEEALATLVNGTAPAAMARAAAERGLPFLHLSTDYVFAGQGSAPHRPGDPPAPLNAYGRSKLAGEAGIRAAGGPHAILRTSWVFSGHGANFVKAMLRLSQTRDRLDVVADQVGGPTPAADIAAALLTVAQALREGQPGGTYHLAGAEPTSWAGLARETFARAGRAVAVRDIPSADFPTPAKRPLNSRLDCATLETDFGIARPDWRDGLDRVLRDLERA
ncbi:MAG: dTDP-4-dehydrorhamnose reductase [Paracoccaceae bacterium]